MGVPGLAFFMDNLLDDQYIEEVLGSIVENYVDGIVYFILTLHNTLDSPTKQEFLQNLSPEQLDTLIKTVDQVTDFIIDFDLWDVYEQASFILKTLFENKLDKS